MLVSAHGRQVHSFKKVSGYFQFHVDKHRMQSTFTASYLVKGGFACYCKMSALALTVCAKWSLYLPPLRKNDYWPNGGRVKGIKIVLQVKSGH